MLAGGLRQPPLAIADDVFGANLPNALDAGIPLKADYVVLLPGDVADRLASPPQELRLEIVPGIIIVKSARSRRGYSGPSFP